MNSLKPSHAGNMERLQ